MHYLNRLQGIKKAKKLIEANRHWRQSFQILIKTRKPCSCWMCGNQRKVYGKTYKEKAADLYDFIESHGGDWNEILERTIENEQGKENRN